LSSKTSQSYAPFTFTPGFMETTPVPAPGDTN